MDINEVIYLGKQSKYVCKCYNITKEDLVCKIQEGFTTYKSLKKEVNLGKKCSSCKDKNKKRVKKIVEKMGASA
jgi:bacterioferritin-associated ferredoxin